MDRITASYDTLLTQAGDTAEVYLRRTIRMLDKEFGEGYARANPELVGQIITAQTADYASGVLGKVAGDFVEAFSNTSFGGN